MSERTALILSPGLLCDARLWKSQADALGDIADIIIADMTLDDTMAGMAARALMVHRLGSRAGLSMGGYVAFEITRQASEKVTKLALFDTGAGSDSPEQTLRRRELIALADRGEFNAVSPRLFPLFVHKSRLSDNALIDEITDMANSVGKAAYLRQQKAIMGRPDSRGRLVDIECPTLVGCGRQDVLTPRN